MISLILFFQELFFIEIVLTDIAINFGKFSTEFIIELIVKSITEPIVAEEIIIVEVTP
jgi:hypothetical protein